MNTNKEIIRLIITTIDGCIAIVKFCKTKEEILQHLRKLRNIQIKKL